MVRGTNKAGEASAYTFNGLGVRVGTEQILEGNSHGYTDFHCQTPSVETGIEKPEVVKTDYVIDYTRLNIDQRVLMKSEQDGYDFFYTYGLDKLQVMTIGEGSNWWGQSVKQCVNMAYVHTDRLGSVVNLSDQYGRVTARADYTDWGEVRRYTDITVDGGFRRLLPEITYATHEYDDVLNQFYAKARMYDAENKRFDTVDPILNAYRYEIKLYIANFKNLVQYVYVKDAPISNVDIDGELPLVVIGAIVGGAVGGIKTAVKAIAEKQNLKDAAKSVAKSVLVGAAAGAVVGSGVAVISTAVSGALGVSTSLATTGTAKVIASASIGATVSGANTTSSEYAQNGKITTSSLAKTATSIVAGGISGGTLTTTTTTGGAIVNVGVAVGKSIADSFVDRATGKEISNAQMAKDAIFSGALSFTVSSMLGHIFNPLERSIYAQYVGDSHIVKHIMGATGEYFWKNAALDFARSETATDMLNTVIDYFMPCVCPCKEGEG